jgi:hypothetical protein
MSKLSNIKGSSSGNAAQIAQSVQAFQSFQSLCDSLTIRAYQELIKRKVHKPDWGEDTFTANFQPIIEQLCVKDGTPIHVHYQTPQLTSSILSGAAPPKTAKVMDLVFSLFAKPTYLKYGIEAKILTSVNTSSRNAKRLCNEYIVSGMDRFINGSYQIAGCMVGYVIAGKTDDALDLINGDLTANSRATEILKDQHTIETHISCYQSRHYKCTLKHFLFLFV